MRHTIRALRAVVGTALSMLAGTATAQNNALSFDGSNDYVQVGLPPPFVDLATRDFSVSLWLRPDGSATPQRVFFAQNSASEFATILLNASATPYFYVQRPAGGLVSVMASAASLPAGQWSHLTVTWNAAAGTAKIFIDGVEAATAAGGSSSTGTSGVLTIGSRSDGQQLLHGAIDGMRIWSAALSADRVRAEAFSTCGAGAPLVASWEFDIGTPGGNNAGLIALPDVTGSGFNGTLMNFALTGASSNWIASPVTRSAPALVFDPPLPASLSTSEDGSGGYAGTVKLAAPPSGDVAVQFASSDDGEGMATPATIDIPASQWNVPQAVSIHGVDDAVIDGPASYGIAISVQSADACYAALAATLEGVNADDDTATVALSGVAQAEGDAGTGGFVFDLTLSDAVAGGFTVAVETVDGSAHAGIDYMATSATVTFAGDAGEVQHVSVPVIGDLVAQGDRTFSLRATGASNPQVVLAPDQADGVIVDDDVDVGVALSDGVDAVLPGQALVYQLTVSNHSPTLSAGDVRVVFDASPLLQNVGWTCAALGGATCAGGAGTFDQTVSLPPGSSAVFAVNAIVPVFDGAPLVAVAHATLAAGLTDSQPGDNQAGDVDSGPAGIFADGFEPPAED